MEPRYRKKRHPILWALAIILALGWISRQGSGSSDGTDRTIARAEPAAGSAAAAAPQPTARITVTPRPAATPRPTVRPTPTPAPTPTPTPSAGTAGVTPEFKAAMDSYEAFFDEYIAFMQAVQEEPGNLALLLQYSTMLERYAQVMEKLDAIGEEELSDADSIYYVQTMARIEGKLLAAAWEAE